MKHDIRTTGRAYWTTIAATFVTVLLTSAAPAMAQYPTAKLKGRLHTEFRTSNITSENADGTPAALNTVPSNEFFLRRAYLEFAAQLAENIHAKAEVNVTRRQANLEDAYIEVGLGRFVSWRFGQEKKPIERQEITSSNLYLTAERGAQIAGLKNPNLVSENNFLVASGFASHDIGTSLEFRAPESLRVPVALRVGVWDGNGKDNAETNDAKTFGGRLVVNPLRKLSLGASFISRDDPISVVLDNGKRVVAADRAGRSRAFGLDGEWGNFESGLHIMADASFGRLSPVAPLTPAIVALRDGATGRAGEPRFRTTNIVAEYKFPLAPNPFLSAVGPLFRFDRTVPDTENQDIASTLLTPGLNLYLSPRAWLMLNYDIVNPGSGLDLGRGPGASVHSFKTMMRIFF